MSAIGTKRTFRAVTWPEPRANILEPVLKSLGLRRCGDATLSKGLLVQRLHGRSSHGRSGQLFLWSAF